MLAVIQTCQFYDEIHSVTCSKTCATEAEANGAIQQMKDNRDEAWSKRMDYVEEFVDAIDPPEPTTYNEWQEYLKQFSPFGDRYVFPKDFKKELKGYLRTHNNDTIIGYDPPPVEWSHAEWYVVELP